MVHVRMCKSLGFCLTTSSTAGVANSDETEPTTYFVGSIVTSNFLLHAVHMTARERDGMRRNNRKFMSCPWVIDMPALCSLTPKFRGACLAWPKRAVVEASPATLS